MELADEISDEYLTCSICLDPYKEPKQLPCLHSFCRRCLADHIANSVPRGRKLSFTCPVCRKVTKPANPDASRLKEWADTFPDNFFILGLMETLNTRSSRSALLNVKRLSESSEDCTRHPENKCDAYCTLKRVGVCGQCCFGEHKECGDHHLNANDAASVTDQKLNDFKIKMEKLRGDVEDIRETFELSKPRELRLQREELALKVSEHFSDLKSKFIKGLIQKEKEVADQLTEIIDKEKKELPDYVNECSSLIKSFSGTVDLFDKLMTSCPINALTALYNMEEQMASYDTAVHSLKSSSETSPVEFIPIVSEVDELMAGVKIGEIKLRETKSGVKLVDGVEGVQEERGEDLDQPGSSVEEFEDRSDQNGGIEGHTVVPSAPPPLPSPTEMPYSLQGFSFMSLAPRPGEDLSRQQPRPESQRSSYYNPTSPTNMASSSRSRSLQARASHDLDISLWRTVAFFGNLTYSERRGGLVGITAMTRNLCAVADRFNNSIKVMSIKGKIVNALTFGNMDPWDITYDKSIKQLVVTCPNQSFLVFVAEDSDINSYYISQTVQTRPYTSISSLKSNMFVVGVCRPFGNPRVDVINSLGSILSYVDTQVQYPRALESLNDGRVVICDWTKKEVAIVGQRGVVDQPYHGVTGDELKEPMGLTKDTSGNVYVLDHKTRKLHIISCHTRNCRAVIPLEGVQDPRMICMVDASRTGQALVVLDSQNGVHVYNMDIPTGQTQV